jgi:hypothetical protein
MHIPQNMEQMKSTQFCSLSLTGSSNKIEHESNACYTPVKKRKDMNMKMGGETWREIKGKA